MLVIPHILRYSVSSSSCFSGSVGIFRSFPAKPLKEMVGTRRLELLTSTVSSMRSAANNPLSVLLFRIETAEKGGKTAWFW